MVFISIATAILLGPASLPASAYTSVHDPVAADLALVAVSATQVSINVTPPPNAFATSPLLWLDVALQPSVGSRLLTEIITSSNATVSPSLTITFGSIGSSAKSPRVGASGSLRCKLKYDVAAT